RAATSPLRGLVLEYRHNLFDLAEITDVSVPDFGDAPYNGDSTTDFNDSAFRPGCDGGLIVGGKTSTDTGIVVEFAIDGETPCRE
ncbi:MAG: hypothetical protein AAGE52_15240, partial [Myxococcota bacterium]